MGVRRATLIMLLALLGVLPAPPAAATHGLFDHSFSGNGWLEQYEVRDDGKPFFPSGVEDMARQRDGKIVVAGELIDSRSNWFFGAFRYHPDGRLDQSFGRGGWVATSIGSFPQAHAVAVQPDGRILVGGELDCPTATCFGIVRYRANGARDTSFGGGDGVVRTKFTRCGCAIMDLALQDNGKIVAVGWKRKSGDGQDSVLFAVARYRPGGALDRSFSGDGRTSIDFGYGNDSAAAVAIQPDGKIVVAGEGTRNISTSQMDFAVARLRRDGTRDTSFGRRGTRTIDFGGQWYEYGNDMTLQGDGKIVVVGSTGGTRGPGMAIARLRPGGGLDDTFAGDGRVRVSLARNGGYADAVAMQRGKIVAVGRAFEGAETTESRWAVARLRPNGRLDSSFAGDGIHKSDFGTGEDWAGAVIARRTKLLVGGSIYESLALARYHAD